MRWKKETVTPTLLLNEAGILVEALKQHVFPPGGRAIGKYQQETPAPGGTAVIAVQFIHQVGERFHSLQIFRLHYVHRAPGRDLWEEYLAAPADTVEMAATPLDPVQLNAQQRSVLQALLQQSDPAAWAASSVFAGQIEGRG